MREAVIVSTLRTPIGRSKKGLLRNTRPDDLGGLAIRKAVEAVGLDPAKVEDVAMGCAMPEAEQGMNVARICTLIAGLPVEVPAITLNRFCSSGLQAIAFEAERILAGSINVAVGGGVESMTMVPMGGNTISLNPKLAEEWPGVYRNMGLTAENVAKQYDISREDQDAFALDSHKKAAEAWEKGLYEAETVPVDTEVVSIVDGKPVSKAARLEKDECVRPDSTLAALAKLRPAFDPKGTVTPGNSSPVTDGAAASVIMERGTAKDLGLEPLAVFKGFVVAACDPEVMGMGPIYAIPKLLDHTGIKLDDVAVIELNEAFSAQALACVRELGLDGDERVNPKGGAIAVGHPLGATGARQAATLIHELRRRGGGLGIVSMCIGGGMGAAGLFEV